MAEKFKSAKKRRIAQKVAVYCILVLLSFFFLIPLYNMVAKSFMSVQESISRPPTWFPSGFKFSNYTKVFEQIGTTNGISYVIVYLINTGKIMILAIPATIFTSCFVAYGFAKINFKGKNIAFMILLSGTMISGSVTMIPSYIIWVKLGLHNTNVPLWIGAWFGGGIMNVFLVRQFMTTIPYVLNESATIEGAGHFRIFFSIILPNCRPIMATLFVGTFLALWNDFTGPLIYLKDKWEWTLAMGVARFGLDGETGGINYLMAACTLMTILPVCMFLFGQKFFIDSIVLSGMKE